MHLSTTPIEVAMLKSQLRKELYLWRLGSNLNAIRSDLLILNEIIAKF